MIEIRLKKKVAAFYSNCSPNRKYFGEIVNEDEEYILFRSVQCDYQGNIIYGSDDKFLKLDVEYMHEWNGKESQEEIVKIH